LTASVGRQFVKTKGASGGGEQGWVRSDLSRLSPAEEAVVQALYQDMPQMPVHVHMAWLNLHFQIGLLFGSKLWLLICSAPQTLWGKKPRKDLLYLLLLIHLRFVALRKISFEQSPELKRHS
jgi:hypothetical protein